ncbi:phage major capsid protein [Cupriavidus sp. AcVe19-1a]|uniref:phage major capsid family protein n=1 Tax=Cupriavidus sp. AcVe19-1a TaxID=2821359 RepID=UPI001AE6327D|nr:phage major capsid protein [Cupriavidus sp. AcVe19-1a]MBP0627729.1 phage major capsid protein [Cupriavidus sp. AcVe19-1a]
MQVTLNNTGRKVNPVVALALDSLRRFAKADTGAVVRVDAANIRAKAAQAPADTGTPTWAGDLVATAVYDFFEAAPASILGALVPLVTKLQVQGQLRVPGHVTPSQAATFIGEGFPLPTIAGDLGAGATLNGAKLATVVTASRELLAAGAGTDVLLESLLAESIATGVDAVLLGNGAGSASQPPGLGAGIVPLTGSADAVADTKAMVEAAPAGAVRLVWLMHPSQLIGATAANIVDGGAIAGAPIIGNMHVTLGDVWLLDAADLLLNTNGDAPEFMRTEEGLLHLDDAALPIVDGAGTVAAPVVSMYQQGLVATRAVLPIYWAMRDPARVIKTSGCTW